MKISESDWRFINSFILRMNKNMDEKSMRKDVLDTLKAVLQYDRGTFWLADETAGNLKEPVYVNFDAKDIENYKDNMIIYDFNKPQFFYSFSTVTRETDILNDVERENSLFYKNAYVPLGIHYVLLVSLVENGRFLGIMAFYRKKIQGDFSDRDMQKMDILKHHIAQKLGQLTTYENTPALSKVHNISLQYNLTDRETEIFAMITGGINNIDICDKLCISENTLKKHISNLYKKLNISSKQELFKLIN